ncbi:hypothetical protein P280DRAFT_530828 [Massarina eburnea CBS 473.64]|uniref:Rhodopsin domain-containing protein n=1 Tax=Massarina eburnea CBS 473.64 TaxID=1395130 RepID=A0A6A6RNP2_9PLEO|nr:hypothetical protein P280DRAFT_530828 [Massarina eburnea CBS 473.64]
MPGVDLCLVPAGIAPDGRPPNFLDMPSLQMTVIILTGVMLALAFLVLMGRLFVNRKTLRMSDWMMVVGFIFDIGVMGTQLSVSSKYRHIWDTPLCHLTGSYLKASPTRSIIFVVDISTGPALFFPKAAIFLFYVDIFSVIQGVRIAFIIGIIVAFMAYFPASLVLSYWDAPHVGQSWDELVTSDMMHQGIPGGITIGVASVMVDIYIFVLPIPTLVGLNLPLGKRIQVVSLFATAFLGVVASVLCMAYRIKLLHMTDGTWQAGVAAIPIIIENNVAIIVGSLPAFANFIRKYIGQSSIYKSLRSKLFSSSLGASTEDGRQQDNVETIGGGSGKRGKKPACFKLGDGTELEWKISVPGETYNPGEGRYGEGIVKTVGIEPWESASESMERLV